MLKGFLGIFLKFLKLFLNYAKGIFMNFLKLFLNYAKWIFRNFPKIPKIIPKLC